MPSHPIHLPEQDLSLFTIPKNGGTTLWWWTYYLRTCGRSAEGNVYDHGWLSGGGCLGRTLIVRRDPVSRFISGYRNFRDKRGLELDFDSFVEAFPSLYATDTNLRHHFTPQSQFYPTRPIASFDHVIDFGKFHEVKEILEDYSGAILPELHHQKAIFDDFQVRPGHLEFIRSFYAEDYDNGFCEEDVEENPFVIQAGLGPPR